MSDRDKARMDFCTSAMLACSVLGDATRKAYREGVIHDFDVRFVEDSIGDVQHVADRLFRDALACAQEATDA